MSRAKQGILSSILLVLESISKKLVGLVSTLILARVLVPDDFGLVAISALFIGFIQIFVQTGSEQYLLRAEKVDRDIINTSWTINFILKGSVAIVLTLLAPIVANYYGDERLIAIIYVFALVMLIGLFASPGPIYLRREQHYGKIVKLSLIAKVFGVIVAVSIALIYESYWALVLGQCTGTIVRAVGSYFIYPFRPAFCLKNAKEQWNFSGWMIPQAILGYSRTQLDTFLISANFGKEALGSYHVMKYLAFIPSSELILPATQPLLVELAKIKDNKHYFALQYNVTFIITMCLALPVTTYMYFHQTLLVEILLGDKWLAYSNLLGIFVCLIPAFVMLNQARRLLLVHAKTKLFFYYEAIAFSILYGTLFYVGFDDLILFSTIRVGIENALCFVFLLLVASYYTSIKNCARMLLGLLPVVLASYIAGIISVTYTNKLHYIVELLYSGMFYIISFSLLIVLQYLLFFRLTKEWQYLYGFAAKGLKAIIPSNRRS